MITNKQKETRKNGIGGSDAGTLVGVNPYEQPYDLYLEKTGEAPNKDIFDNPPIHFGNIFEPVVINEYMRKTGKKVRRVNKTLQHPDLPFVLGHIDGDVLREPRAIEVKLVTSPFVAKEWGAPSTDEIPERHLMQVQHYMALLPKIEVFDVVALFGVADFRIYEIPRDETIILNLMDIEADFWTNHVQKRIPPDIDHHHASTEKLLSHLYPGTNGETITLPESALVWAESMQDAQAQIKEFKEVVKVCRNRLKDSIGDNAIGILPDGSGGFRRRTVKRKGYEVKPCEYMDLRFSKTIKRQ